MCTGIVTFFPSLWCLTCIMAQRIHKRRHLQPSILHHLGHRETVIFSLSMSVNRLTCPLVNPPITEALIALRWFKTVRNKTDKHMLVSGIYSVPFWLSPVPRCRESVETYISFHKWIRERSNRIYSSPIQSQSSPIPFESSPFMRTIRERTNSFAALCT